MVRSSVATCCLCMALGSALAAQTVALGSPGTAAAVEFKPLIRPTIQARPVSGGIVVDGRLDDAGWRDAAMATGFSEFSPRDLVAAAVPVEAWITYDEKKLYVAFRVRDDPAAVRASLRGRDDVLSDDVVAVILDPFANNATGYLIGANPLGVQVDMRITASSEDWGFDLLYESAGRVTETGYEVEMAIPFSSLQFPKADVQEWRINFIKLHPRSTMRQYAWGALAQNDSCLLCQNGHLNGLRGIKAGGRIELLPSLVASQSASLGEDSDPSSFRNGRPVADVSLGVRYPFRPGWTAEATYNPDFSQVESDAAQIDVNTTYALSFPERRPFFQEGGELFETPVAQVYTRSINSPVAAGKMVGRQGRVRVGYIGAVDERTPILVPLEERTLFVGGDRSISNILRAEAALGDGSHVGLLLTDRRYDGGGSGSSAGADARIRLNGQWQIRAQIVASHTAEPDTGHLDDRDLTFGEGQHSVALDGDSFAGRAAYLNISRSSRKLSFGATYRDATPTFRTASGFQSRNDYRNVSAYANWTVRPAAGLVDRATVALHGLQGVSFDGAVRERSVSPSVHVQLKRQTYANGGINHADERFDGQMYRSLTTAWGSISSAPGEKLTVGVYANGGDWILRKFGEGDVGRGLSLGMNGEVKATNRFVIEPSIAYQRMTDRQGDELFAGYIARSRLSYQFTRELNARVVVQYNDFAEALTVEPLIMYRLNPLSILYVGSTHGYSAFDAPYGFERTDRQFFLKLQYLVRP